jgi:hypothetical protein
LECAGRFPLRLEMHRIVQPGTSLAAFLAGWVVTTEYYPAGPAE